MQARTAVSVGETVSIKAVLIKTVLISRGADISGKFRNGARLGTGFRRVGACSTGIGPDRIQRLNQSLISAVNYAKMKQDRIGNY